MKLTFFGQSAWGLEGPGGDRILVDPYPISDEANALLTAYPTPQLSHILVSHAGFDHLGIALDLAREHPHTRLVADIAVVRHAGQSGIPAERIDVAGWNMGMTLGHWHVRVIEAKHASAIEGVNGDYLTGMPLGFVIRHEAEPEVSVMHVGDTSIFSDLTLFGQLYRPMVTLINVAGAMDAREASLATLWTGSDVALPMHFTRKPEAAEEYCAAVSYLPRPVRAWVPTVGASYTIERETRIVI